MPPIKKKEDLFVYCKGCYMYDKNGFPNTFPKFKAKKNATGDIVSSQLSRHLLFHDDCFGVYLKMCSGTSNYESSLILDSQKNWLSEKDRNQLGLTFPSDAPSRPTKGRPKIDVNNRNFMFDALVEPIDSALIEQELTDALPSFLSSEDEALTDGSTTVFTTPSEVEGRNVLKIRIKLMKIMKDHNIPQCAEREIYDWAHEAQMTPGFTWDNALDKYFKRETTLKEMYEVYPECNGGGTFNPQLIDWRCKPVVGVHTGVAKQELYVRSFTQALRSLITNVSLMKQENLAFPNDDTPISPEHNPPITDDTMISELHHGSWWTETWRDKCCEEKDEILVPIILYMDGIAVDSKGKHSICPLNMTLGIFNDFTRATRRDAWETIYYHPQRKGDSSTDNIRNLHASLLGALATLREACNGTDGLEWTNLPWNNKLWRVRMRFAIAFVIGDTEMHDKLCGRYGSRNITQSMLCRHCNCPSDNINIPRSNFLNAERKLWKPSDFDSPTIVEGTMTEQEYFKSISHHRIKNCFHGLDFGANEHNIHFASPSEKLHMHQLGVAARATETLTTVFLSGKKKLIEQFEAITSYYGPVIHRQSDRDFPRTRFSETINTARKEGNQYAGMLFLQLMAMTCHEGRTFLTQKEAGLTHLEIDHRVYVLELVLGMEEFLKYSATRKDIRQLSKMVIHFVSCINNHLKRAVGAGNKLIKNHMYFHLPEYIAKFGPPSGWDSSPSESNHKTEVKAPAKRTQLNQFSLIKQTGLRHLEYRAIERLASDFGMSHDSTASAEPLGPNGSAGGSWFTIGYDGQDEPSMVWERSKRAKKKACTHNRDVIKFVCEKVLPAVSADTISGFTEHKRYDSSYGKNIIFRSNSTYRSDSPQAVNLWYDWATFVVDLGKHGKKRYTCQILCFLKLEELTGKSVPPFVVDAEGLHAVVRCLERENTLPRSESTGAKHAFVTESGLKKGFYLFHCDNIFSEVAVVANKGKNGSYLTLSNRDEWLQIFLKRMRALERKSLPSVVEEGESPQRGVKRKA